MKSWCRPEKRVLNVEVTPSSETYLPGQKARFKLQLTDYYGEPFTGTAAITVYDRAVEYISGGSNVPEIREFFWKWRRSHHPHRESNLTRWFRNLLKKGEIPMRNIGVFGHLVQTPGEGAAGRDEFGMADSIAEFRSDAAPRPAAPEAEVAEESVALQKAPSKMSGVKRKRAGKISRDDPAGLVKPTVRTRFADTAFWSGTVMTDEYGVAEVEFTMPENLTGWKAKVWAMGHGTRVGEGSVEVVTRKDLIVRLQAPRFFV